jgi:hypothetical protein
MADRKLTDSPAITAADVDPANDLIMVVDKSDTTDAASGTSKKMTGDQLEICLLYTSDAADDM